MFLFYASAFSMLKRYSLHIESHRNYFWEELDDTVGKQTNIMEQNVYNNKILLTEKIVRNSSININWNYLKITIISWNLCDFGLLCCNNSSVNKTINNISFCNTFSSTISIIEKISVENRMKITFNAIIKWKCLGQE